MPTIASNPVSLLGALYWNCVVILVMSTIFVGTSISEVTDEDNSVQDSFFLVLSVVPSVVLSFIGMGMTKNGATPEDSKPLSFGIISLILSLAEGFMAAACLAGLIQKMYAALAALQFGSILAIMLWQATLKSEEQFERM